MKTAQWYVNHKLKAPDKFFKNCIEEIPVFEWKNKKQSITNSHEGRKVIQKRLTKNSKLDFFHTKQYRAIVLSTKNRIEIQTYVFYVNYEKGKEILEYELYNYELFSKGEHIQIGIDWMGYKFGLTETQFMSGYYTMVRFYNNDWIAKLQSISELRYIDLSNCFIGYGIDKEIRTIYKYRNEIEFAQKINAKRLANDLIFQNCKLFGTKNIDMRTVNMKWLKKNKQFFRNSKLSFEEFELSRKIKARNGRLIPGIEKYLNYRQVDKIPKGVGINKFQKWIIKNKIEFNYYLDYLSILNDLEIKLNVDNLIIPKDLKKAHDNAVKLLNQKKDRQLQEAFSQRRNYSDRLIKGYIFMYPKTPQEIIAEGKNLSHCVGSSRYISDHANGKTTIIFIRKANEPNISYYTMEFKSGKIMQIRGKHNSSAPDDIMQAAEIWKNKLN